MINTKIAGFKLRLAEKKDMSLVFGFVKELAAYERLEHEVIATEENLHDSIFERKIAEVVIGEFNEEPVCFGLFFYSLSTFIGKPGIYLEDLFVRPEFRGKGFGKTILAYLAKLAIERDCWGLEWACLSWNEPSIRFYKGIGAKERSEWRIYRLRDEALGELAKEF